MWQVVNKERGKNSQLPIDFADIAVDANGDKFSTKLLAANAMNNRFAGAAAACGAPRADLSAAHAALAAARAPADRCWRLRPFTPEEVYRIIRTQIPRKPTKDIYDISMEIIYLAAGPLSPALANLFNKCIKEGIFPTALKLSKVCPLFKGKGKREDIDGYRPVSIIPAVGKIFENGISSRLTAYLETIQALSSQQYAYRAGRSTAALARQVVHRVVDARERGQQVAVLCCDLSKAFDVADHDVLAIKLRHYGIDGLAHALISDILRDRSQVVVSDGGRVRSDPVSTTMGVAQGSSVSNILFSLLLNDLPEAVPAAEIFMYADDVAGVVSASSAIELELRLNEAAEQVSRFFRINGLVLNLKKTYFLHFHLGGKIPKSPTVVVDGIAIEQVRTTTFLGFELDDQLRWESHLNKLCTRLGSACFALRRLARVVPQKIVRACYFATVHSLMQYGAELWGRASEWERVFRMQKKAIRAIVQVSQDESARSYFKSLRILTLPSIVILQVGVYVRCNLSEYTTRGEVCGREMRNANRLVGIRHRLAKSRKLTHVMGPTVYNRLPVHIIDAP